MIATVHLVTLSIAFCSPPNADGVQVWIGNVFYILSFPLVWFSPGWGIADYQVSIFDAIVMFGLLGANCVLQGYIIAGLIRLASRIGRRCGSGCDRN